MTKQQPKKRKLHKNIEIAYAKVRRAGGLLCRQSSDTEDGIKGGGFIYFSASGGTPISPVLGRFLIDHSLVEPVNDGLFDGSSQTFRVIERDLFEAFKAKYEEPVDVHH